MIAMEKDFFCEKQIVTGILAHVDAGKTTLTESMLYVSGTIRNFGKVDRGDAFLDNHELERLRGITIFSKQAGLTWENTHITILDTPGHVDFSAETERTLSVLDYAILVVSGPEGVQGHTRTLWELLERYDIPVFIFVNKMDRPETDRLRLMEELKTRLDGACVDFTDVGAGRITEAGADRSGETAACMEEIAACDEEAMNEFFDTGRVSDERISRMIWERKLFPCYFGSALKVAGIEEFLDGFSSFTIRKSYPTEFGARVYKITRDAQGARLTHMKITGGTLCARQVLQGGSGAERAAGSGTGAGAGSGTGAGSGGSLDNSWEEKVTQIRIYNGEKYEAVQEAAAGEVCAVTGLTHTYSGEGFGFEAEAAAPLLKPVLSRQILLPEGTDIGAFLPKLRMLQEEQPDLGIVWDERLQEIRAQVMGEVQIEILQSLIVERFGVNVDFGPPSILYKETITEPVEGVGHFEPLRHYAEVHLLMEPLPPGSGLVFAADCSEDLLDRNWQRLILTHLGERTHRGVLTGAPITDIKITVIAGRANPKHTSGGDFRQATYRAVRQGLMETECRVLEPYYDFRLEIPAESVGRAMTDIEQMNGHFDAPVIEEETAVLTGYAPVACMQDYKQEVGAYTKGFGRLSFSLRGYDACHNEEDVIVESGYDPEADTYQTPDSVFCANGAGYIVPWYEVKEYMHVESPLMTEMTTPEETMETAKRQSRSASGRFLGTEEVDAILAQASQANRGAKRSGKSGVVKLSRGKPVEAVQRDFRSEKSADGTEGHKGSKGSKEPKEQYLIVDGYNVIHAWDELEKLMMENLDAARVRLMDELCNYQGMRQMNLIVVFDAYRVENHQTEISDYHNIHVVFTKEAETADQYIEKFAHTNAKKYDVTVATSDGLEQIIIRGEGCKLLSSRELISELQEVHEEARSALGNASSSGAGGAMQQAVERALKEDKAAARKESAATEEAAAQKDKK